MDAARRAELYDLSQPALSTLLMPGDTVRVVFERPDPGASEGLWLEVTARSTYGRYVGALRNDPEVLPLPYGAQVAFGPEHVLELYEA